TGSDDTINKPARQALHEKGVNIIDRFVPNSHIGHNKFVVYVGPDNQAKAVLLGSTNWTDTALCAQSNNALVVENETIAQAYFDYWRRLHADTGTDGRGRQSSALRQANALPSIRELSLDSGSVTVWFSP